MSEANEVAAVILASWYGRRGAYFTLSQARVIVRAQMPNETEQVIDAVAEALVRLDRNSFSTPWSLAEVRKATPPGIPIACTIRMPPDSEYVLMWETYKQRWSVGSWWPQYRQWSNRDDPEYAIHPDQVSHWQPLLEIPT